MLGRVLDILGQVSEEVIVVVAQGQDLPVGGPGVIPLVETDIYPGKGALGGIYTGVLSSASFHNLVVGADMPFLNPSLLRYLMSLAPGYDVVMPSINREIEPLHAIYSRECLEPMRRQIDCGDLTIRHFLHHMKVRYVQENEFAALDPEGLSFFNVNTPADLKKAEALAANFSAPEA